MRLLAAVAASMASAALVLAIIAVFNAGDSEVAAQPGGAGGPAAPTAEGDAPGASVLELELSEFGIGPDTLHAVAGADLTLEVTNTGGVQHDLLVEGVGQTPLIDGGGSASLELGALEAGTYHLLCSVPGHADLGMRATLVVGEGAGEPAAGGDGGHGAGGAGTVDHSTMSPEEMDRVHMAVMEAYPAETEGQGGQLLEPVIAEDGTKVFELTASEFEWEVEPGVVRQAMGYNGMVPGPEIRVQLGDRVRIILHNELSEPTALHSHGLIVPNEMDGVPGLTQDSIMPGESFTYEFEVVNAGSHMYHSHYNSAHQVTSGLLGAFIVEDPEAVEVDQDVVLVLNDGPLGYTINGKGFPATQPIVAKQGEKVRIRYMNEGLQIHPMHLHGLPQLVVARDGYPLVQPQMMDTVLVAPGERIDVLVDATDLGAWAFHCHILSHAEGPQGMFGMVTAMIVEE